MDLLHWIAIGFIIIGFVVLIKLKRKMESKLAFISNMESEDSSTQSIVKRSTRSIVSWIWGTAVWGIVSMILVVWLFSVSME